MTNEQTNTPETDDAARKGAYLTHGKYPETCGKQIVHIDFARRLEKERDSAKTLNKTLLDQLEAQAVQIEALRDAIKEAHEALEEMLTAFDSETARQYYTATSSGGWTMLEIGACSSGRAALAKLKPLLP